MSERRKKLLAALFLPIMRLFAWVWPGDELSAELPENPPEYFLDDLTPSPRVERAASTLASALFAHDNAPNFLTFTILNDHGEDVVVTVRYKSGKTPSEVIRELKQELNKYKALEE